MLKEILYDLLVNNNIQILQKNIDWYTFFTSSVMERVEGFLFKILMDNNLMADIPKPIKKMLYLSYKYNQEKNFLYNKEFQNIQHILCENGVNVFPYRGLFLINSIYKDYGVRYMEDIDIVTFVTDHSIIETLLKKHNYHISLINDNDIAYYHIGETIHSCLFVKSFPKSSLIPFVKLDISFGYIILKSEYISSRSNNPNLLPECIFLLLCKGLFEDASGKTGEPIIENCTLIKIIDIIHFIKKYPRQAEYILNYSAFSSTEFVKFTQRCIDYFSKGDQE